MENVLDRTDRPNRNPFVLSCVNLKGGVGKTAIAVNFAAYCGKKGIKTLLVDLDPQTNATFSCIDVPTWEAHAANNGTIADLLDARRHTSAEGKPRAVDSVVRRGVFTNVDLIPSHLDLFTIDLDLGGATGRERKLRRALAPISHDYSLIVCDCPPNLTIPTQNALAASSHYIVPVSPDFLSAIGVGILLERVREFCEALEHTLSAAGIVLSRVGRPALHRAEVVRTVEERFGELVLTNQLAERVAVSKAASANHSVFDEQDREAIVEFQNVSEELLSRIGYHDENP